MNQILIFLVVFFFLRKLYAAGIIHETVAFSYGDQREILLS